MAREKPALEVPPYAAASAQTVRWPDGDTVVDRLAVEERSRSGSTVARLR